MVKAQSTGTATLAWDANPESDVMGYRLLYGTTSGNYTQTIDAGNTTTATVANLAMGTPYFFAATAYNSAGLESLPCPEIIVVTGNNAPVISPLANLTITEDSSTGALAFTVGDSETAAGSLMVTGSSSNPALVPTANIGLGGSGANRTVTVIPAAQQSGTAVITLNVSDGAATTSSSFLLTVTTVNDAPVIFPPASLTISEDSSTGALAFTVGDSETAAGSLTLTGSSSNPALVPTANIGFGGSGANRTVTVTPAAQQNGTAVITLNVSDGAATTSGSFLLTVTAVNDAPVISPPASLTITEDSSTGALAFTVGDSEAAAGSLMVTGSSSNPVLVPTANIGFGGSGANRTVTVTPAAQQNGTAVITLSVSDGAATASSSFLLTVTAVVPPGLWEIVALTGDLATGTGGAHFLSFTSGVRSDGPGNAAFRANLDSALGSTGGVWTESNGLLGLVARQGAEAPGVTGGRFGVFEASPWWSGTGHLLLQAKLQTGSGGVTLSNDDGLWLKSPSGPLQLVARENGQAPGFAAGARLQQLGNNAVLGEDGRYAFTAVLKTNKSLRISNENNSGLWTNFQGLPAVLVREGAAAPGTRNGESFDTLTSALISANSSGQIAFSTLLKQTSAVTSANRSGIWMWDGARLALIARAGNQAPGTPAGAVFGQPGTPLLRDAMLVFHANLATSGGGVTSSDDTGIWALENGAVTLLAREGSAAPGAPLGAVYHSLPTRLAGNDSGNLIFPASLRAGNGVDASNDGGIWARSPATGDALTLIAREGLQAPQAPTDAVFTTFGTALVSGGGREAFIGNLLQGQGGVTTANDRGLWMRATTGGINLMLREGDMVAVSPTDLRRVADIILDASSEASAASFSSSNSIKIVVSFTDGSSAMLSCDAP